MLSLLTTFLALRAPAAGKHMGRRAILGAATAVVAAPAAFALSPEERAFEAAAGYQKAVSQCENDACAALPLLSQPPPEQGAAPRVGDTSWGDRVGPGGAMRRAAEVDEAEFAPRDCPWPKREVQQEPP